MHYKNTTFLVTGGAGFIGSHTVDALIKKGARVIVVDNLSTGRKENLNPKAVFYKMDIADPKLEAIFKKEKPHYVYHFAFNVLVPKSVEDPIMDAQCIIASLNLLQCAESAKVRKIVYSSSSFLYGNTKIFPTDEKQPVDVTAPYVVSKRAVENYLRYYRQAFGLPYVILRYGTTYGPRQVNGAMADYIRKLKADKQADIWGNGKKTRDYVFVEDVVRANLLALTVPDSFSDPLFNVGTNTETTLNQLYGMIADILKKPAKPIYHPDRAGELMRFRLSYSKIKKALNWEPRVTLEQGLRKILES